MPQVHGDSGGKGNCKHQDQSEIEGPLLCLLLRLGEEGDGGGEETDGEGMNRGGDGDLPGAGVVGRSQDDGIADRSHHQRAEDVHLLECDVVEESAGDGGGGMDEDVIGHDHQQQDRWNGDDQEGPACRLQRDGPGREWPVWGPLPVDVSVNQVVETHPRHVQRSGPGQQDNPAGQVEDCATQSGPGDHVGKGGGSQTKTKKFHPRRHQRRSKSL